jgi:hypothetical protein
LHVKNTTNEETSEKSTPIADFFFIFLSKTSFYHQKYPFSYQNHPKIPIFLSKTPIFPLKTPHFSPIKPQVTDAVLTALMAAARSANSWDIVVTQKLSAAWGALPRATACHCHTLTGTVGTALICAFQRYHCRRATATRCATAGCFVLHTATAGFFFFFGT